MVEGERHNYDNVEYLFIISSWIEHLKEAKDVMGGGVRWLGGRWGVTLYFLSIV